MPILSTIGCFFLYGCSVQEAGAQQGHRHSRVQAIWCRARGSGAERRSWCRAKLVQEARPGAGWGKVQGRCTQAVGDLQQGVGRSAAGHRLQCSRAQAWVEQGTGSGAARRRLGCSRAQARVQQGAGSARHRRRCNRAQAWVQQSTGAGAGAASKGAQEGLFAASKGKKEDSRPPFLFFYFLGNWVFG
ncbi:hypothetical protein SLEP1_g16636 [Rubroshorea leprosula]|uniref:Uncharacterized protein n=1 Tax=Rubroshorea leprosula TaxID=152421 RepID=A0AAV5IVD3_9ROSI|nr:hypothetical protein SLEP1_g16636 [Rubroshorea leprosula]